MWACVCLRSRSAEAKEFGAKEWRNCVAWPVEFRTRDSAFPRVFPRSKVRSAGGKNAKSCYLLPWGLFFNILRSGHLRRHDAFGSDGDRFFGYARRWGRGPWPAYLMFALLGAAIVSGLGLTLILTMPEVAGAPGDEFFEHVVLGSCCIAATPGFGMLAGLLGLCFRRRLRTARDC